MRRLKHMLAAAALSAAPLLNVTHAEPLDPTQVPADSKWVIHLDMDAVKQQYEEQLAQHEAQHAGEQRKASTDPTSF